MALDHIYYNLEEPASFSSARALFETPKQNLTRKEVQSWLETQDTYTLHRNVIRKFLRNKYIVSNIDDLFQADLVDLSSLSKYNDGVRYILTVIDVFSKVAWVKPLRAKTGKAVSAAFNELFGEQNRIPVSIQTDKGKEFLAADVQKLFKHYNINFYVAQSPDVKAAVIERFNRTLKNRMFRYFTYVNNYRYIDVLEKIVQAYNNSKHRTIGMAPKDVNSDNILQVYKNAYGSNSGQVTKRALYKVGDFVRISRYKHVFEKGYTPNWSEEIFKITAVVKRHPIVYKLCDLMDEPIEGIFYQPELQRVSYTPTKSFKVDKILKKRHKRGITELYVKWRGYPEKFNSWVREDLVTDI